MIIGYHVIFGPYGFWLPNDPRGSWSDYVASWNLYKYGPSTKTETRESVAHKPHDIQQRLAAKNALKHPPVVFDGVQAKLVAEGFAELDYSFYACSILPDHVHLVLGPCRFDIEKVVVQLKARATTRLKKANYHYPVVWAVSCWKVFLNNEETLQRAIRYVEENPLKEGKKQQHWKFVQAPFQPSIQRPFSPRTEGSGAFGVPPTIAPEPSVHGLNDEINEE